MSSVPAPTSIDSPLCPACQAPLDDVSRHCPACGRDIGAPNVRAASTTAEAEALTRRVGVAQDAAEANGTGEVFRQFRDAVQQQGSVVIALPAAVARNMVVDSRTIYVNYERLVHAGVRTAAVFAEDSHRRAVAGSLFGGYAESICYGVLSLTGAGLPTYGDIFCRLRAVTVELRASLLEENSYSFVNRRKPRIDDPIPAGYRAPWHGRHILAAAKLGPRLRPENTITDWQELLVWSDGVDRTQDEFIEVHLFEGFNLYSIESLVPVKRKRSREGELDVKAAMAAFSKHFAARKS